MDLTEEQKPNKPWHFAVIKAWEEYWLAETGKPWTDEMHGVPDSPPQLWLGEIVGFGGIGHWLVLDAVYSDVQFYLGETEIYMSGEIWPAGDAFKLVDQARAFAKIRDEALVSSEEYRRKKREMFILADEERHRRGRL